MYKSVTSYESKIGDNQDCINLFFSSLGGKLCGAKEGLEVLSSHHGTHHLLGIALFCYLLLYLGHWNLQGTGERTLQQISNSN